MKRLAFYTVIIAGVLVSINSYAGIFFISPKTNCVKAIRVTLINQPDDLWCQNDAIDVYAGLYPHVIHTSPSEGCSYTVCIKHAGDKNMSCDGAIKTSNPGDLVLPDAVSATIEVTSKDPNNCEIGDNLNLKYTLSTDPHP